MLLSMKLGSGCLNLYKMYVYTSCVFVNHRITQIDKKIGITCNNLHCYHECRMYCIVIKLMFLNYYALKGLEHRLFGLESTYRKV